MPPFTLILRARLVSAGLMLGWVCVTLLACKVLVIPDKWKEAESNGNRSGSSNIQTGKIIGQVFKSMG
jgi:hypothetical protein